jgi:hypothetical protein
MKARDNDRRSYSNCHDGNELGKMLLFVDVDAPADEENEML